MTYEPIPSDLRNSFPSFLLSKEGDCLKIATLNYLKHRLEIKLPNPEEDNQILISIYREEGTYSPEDYNADLTHYQFSAQSSDPNKWVIEGIESAIAELSTWGVKFHETIITIPEWDDITPISDDLDSIPF